MSLYIQGFTFLICFVLSASGNAAEIVSFKTDFQKFIAAADNRSMADQVRLWDELVEKPHKDFYERAVWEKRVRPNWIELKDRVLPERLKVNKHNKDKILKAFDEFQDVVQKQIRIVEKIIPEFKVDFPIYAILAPNFDAKSVVFGSTPESVGLAIAIDSIVIENASYDILFPHELFHAYHAKLSGFVNDGVMADTTIIVPMWEEGLATYVSGLANKGATDSELLFDKSFGKMTSEDIKWLAQKFITDMQKKTLDPEPTDTFKRWFSTGNLKLKEGLPNRCGYFLGLTVVQEIAKSHSLKEMVSWKPSEIRKPIYDALLTLKK